MRSASTANSWRWPRATDSSKWRRLAWIERVAYGDSQVSSCRSKIWRSSDNLTIQALLPKISILAQELARLNGGVAVSATTLKVSGKICLPDLRPSEITFAQQSHFNN